MTETLREENTQRLRQLMAQARIPSFKALAQAAGVSDWVIQQVRDGQAESVRLSGWLGLSRALHISLGELVEYFCPGVASVSLPESVPLPADAASSLDASEAAAVQSLRQEYQRLQAQMADLKLSLEEQFQENALNQIESWLLNWPTAAHQAQQKPELPAMRLVPLLQPVHALLTAWGVRAIAPVGAEVPYDPHQHQLLEGTAQPGDRVYVRNTGYWHNDKLLFRAKVKPLQS